MMKVKIITRFSIPAHTSNAFRRPELVYLEDRLLQKFRAFYGMTMRSVLHQTVKEWEWHVVAGEWLQGRLALPDDPRVFLHLVPDYGAFRKTARDLGRDSATMRLDDDDWIAPDLLERLRRHEGAEVVSFTHGHKYKLLPVGYAINRTPYIRPSLAVGLTRMRGNIYEWGHDNIPVPVTMDDSRDAWMVCCGDWCDTERVFETEKTPAA